MSFINRIIPKLSMKKQAASKLGSLKRDVEEVPFASISTGEFELEKEEQKPAKTLLNNKEGGKEETMEQFLKNHVLFKGLGSSFLSIIASSMQARIFNDMDFVIKKGQVGRAMFFVQRGEVEVISEDGTHTLG